MSFICDFICLFFFFKQKTAYEMRISDWSSDVCSSDLTGTTLARVGGFRSEERERLARRDAVNDYCIAPRDCAARSPRGPDHRLQDLNRTVLLAARSLDSRTRKLFAQYRRREGLFCQHRGGRTTLERSQRTVRGDARRDRADFRRTLRRTGIDASAIGPGRVPARSARWL